MRLPGHFHNEADLHPGVLVRAAETVHHEEPLAGELLDGEGLELFPYFLGELVVVVRILRSVPPYGVLGVLVHHNVLVLRRTSGIDAGHYIDRAELGHLTFVVTFKLRLGLFVVENLVGGVVKDFRGSFNTVLA